jgi:hypothetical protein
MVLLKSNNRSLCCRPRLIQYPHSDRAYGLGSLKNGRSIAAVLLTTQFGGLLIEFPSCSCRRIMEAATPDTIDALG